MKKALIVGIDPGVTTAISILDIKKNLLYLFSKKDFKKGEIIRIITQFGKPIVIACDKKPASEIVVKLSKSLGSRIFKPNKILTFKEKNKLVKNWDIKFKNSHERDALIAALKAYKNYFSIFKKVEAELKRENKEVKIDEAIIKLFFEKPNIKESIESLK